VTEGRFTLLGDCDVEQYYLVCAQAAYFESGGVLLESGEATLEAWSVDDCPAELVSRFVDGDKGVWARDPRQVRIGNAEPIPCYGADNELCGKRVEGVAAGGCSWRVDVVTDPRLSQFMVYGKANEGCARASPYCTTGRTAGDSRQ
jgi:hypothetical protein